MEYPLMQSKHADFLKKDIPLSAKMFSKVSRRRKNTKRKRHNNFKGNGKKKGLLLKKITIPYTDSYDNSEEQRIISICQKNTTPLHPSNSLTGIYYELSESNHDEKKWKSKLRPIYFDPGLNGTPWHSLSINEKKASLLNNEYIQNALKEIEIYNVKLLSRESPSTIFYNETIPIDIQYTNINKRDYKINTRAITFNYPHEINCYLEAQATTPEKPGLVYKSYEDISLVIHNDEAYRNTKKKFEEVHALIKEPYNLDVLAEELIQKTTHQLQEQASNVPTLKFFK